jgi:uncharacterized protein
MPVNPDVYYLKAEAEYHEAKTTPTRLKALKKMLATAPTHKGAERLRGDIKKRIAQLKYRGEQEKKGAGKRGSLSIHREGAAQIMFLGLPNSGKSTLLSQLSGKKVKIAEYEFTTTKPEVRAIPYENLWLQAIELPAIYEGFAESKMGRQYLSLVRNADFVVVVCKEFTDIAKIQAELKKANIFLRKEKVRDAFVQYMPHMIVTWKDFPGEAKIRGAALSKAQISKKNKLAKSLWEAQKKIRVQTRVAHKIAPKPIILKRGATVEDVAITIHKDMIKKFRFAKVRGPSAHFKDEQVGLDHVLKDTDIIEVFMQ